MTSPVKDMALTERRDDLALTPQDRLALTVQALAENPNVDVGKLKELIELQRMLLAEQAESAFDAAMSQAQAEMRPVAADATNPQTRSQYASFAALDRALRPIYTRYGFSVSFDTDDAPLPDYVRVVCLVTHTGGHRTRRHIDMPADGKGAKGGDVMTKTHAVASGVSYGMRYLEKMVFNVAVGEDDDDGNRAGGRAEPEPPQGYQDWLDDLTVVAEDGLPALQATWKSSNGDYRRYLTKYFAPQWEALKKRAAKAGTAS